VKGSWHGLPALLFACCSATVLPQNLRAGRPKALAFELDLPMRGINPSFKEVQRVTATFDKVADIIAETSEIDRETIKPESHTIDDLGIDSLDFLDIVFAIDKEFGIKIPLEKWTQEVNEGKVSTEEYFVLKNLCAKIDELRAAKA
jgi:acyl carrier protein